MMKNLPIKYFNIQMHQLMMDDGKMNLTNIQISSMQDR